MAEPARAEPRYRAFLSYSHKDAAEAARIHRRLESYRLPKRLVGRLTDRGQVPPRLWPIFRDREELAAATDLSETVRAALAESAALIVLCSPDAAASLWVSEEIATFRRLYPDRPVLAAILAGDPPACFPEALWSQDSDGTWHEPLATDLRRQGDGPHLGLLKLVAGITGVPLDDLVQRDATRRVRRVTAVTVGAVVAMLVMAALALFALDSRREAERQRAEAEGLIEFMLTDLRDRLKGVGRLDAMDAANSRALSYYAAQGDRDRWPDDSLSRRARILHAIGDDNLARHDLGAALAAFREAHRTTEEQLRRAPNDSRRIFEHAKSDIGLGRVFETHHDWTVALQHYLEAAEGASRLVALAPRNPDYVMRVAATRVDVGNIQLKHTREYAAAQESYGEAVLWLERAFRMRPNDHHILLSQANAYGWLADSFYVRRCWFESRDARLRQYEIMQRLYRANTNNAEIDFQFAAARRGLGHSYLQLGVRGAARDQFGRAHAATMRLTSLEPHNAGWRELHNLLLSDLLQVRVPGRPEPPRRCSAIDSQGTIRPSQGQP